MRIDFREYDNRKLLLLLLFSLIAVETVVAQQTNILDTLSNNSALQGITGARFADFYEKYWWLVDLIVYSLILGYAIKFGLKNSNAFGNQGDKLGTVVAIVFAIFAVIFEQQQGFRLGHFGPLAFGIGILVIGFAIWKAVGGMGLGENGKVVGALLYLFIYGLIAKYFQPLRERQDWSNLIPAFLDILAVVMFVLLIIGVISLVRNLGGGGGSGGRGGLFGGGRPRPGNAAIATAEDQAALAEDSAEAKQRVAEIAEAAREMKDLQAIRQIAYRELKDYGKIKDDIKKMIGALQRMAKAGRMSPELVDEVRLKVADAVNYANDIRSLEPTLQLKITELANLGMAEKGNINAMFQGTKRQIGTEIAAGRTAGWTGTGPNNAKWAQIKQKFEQDAGTRIDQQIKVVRNRLGTHVTALGGLERAFTGYFTQAEAALRANDIPQSILQLEGALSDIKQVESILKAVEGNDVNTIQNQIKKRLADLSAETKTATLNSIGIKKQMAVVKKSAAASRGLKNAGKSAFRGMGRLIGRP